MESMGLKLPGAVFFVSNVYSLFTGLIFTVIVTRSLTVSEFGFWSMLSQYFAYTVIPLSSIASFWIVRYVARGFKQAPKTGILFGVILFFIGMPTYLLVAFLANLSFSHPLFILLLATPQVVTFIFLGALNGLATGSSPIHIGFSNIVFETSKIIVAYLLVRVFKIGLIGAIISVLLAQIIQIIYLVYVLRRIVIESMTDLNLVKKWFKLSWLPLYELFSGIIGGLDVLIGRIVSSGDALIGVRSVAGVAGSFPRYASSLSLSLYPRSLRDLNERDRERDVEEMLKFMGLIAIPIAFGNIFLMDLILAVFGRNYLEAYLAGVVIVIASLVGLVNSITEPIIKGLEEIDLKEEVIFRDYLKSRIFKLLTINHLTAVIYVLAVFFTLKTYFSGDIYQAAFYWSLASFSSLPFTIYKIKMMEKAGVKFNFPVKNISKYVFCSTLMVLLISVLRTNLFNYGVGKVVDLFLTILSLTIIGGCFYFVIVFLIDDYARKILSQSLMLLRQLMKPI